MFRETNYPALSHNPDRYYRFGVAMPIDTHWRVLTCREASDVGECVAWTDGYVLEVPRTAMPQDECEALLTQHGLKFLRVPENDPGHYALYLFPGQRCFHSLRAPHRIPNGRPPIFTSAVGDFRAIDTGTHRVMKGEDWLDMFANNQLKIEREVQRG